MSVRAQLSFQDTIPIKEITVKDTRFAGGKIEKIDTLVLQNHLNTTLADVLEENTNIYIHSAAKGSLATASMRGAGASHTKVLWENLPINSPMTGQVDLSLLPVCFIDEVSLQYGSASIISTGGALGGSILLENSPDWRKGFNGKIAQGYGSYGTYSGIANAKWAVQKLNIRTRVFYENSKNNFKYKNNTIPEEFQQIETLKNGSYRRYGLLEEMLYRTGENSTLSLNYWFQNNERNIPGLMNNGSPNHEEKQFDLNHRLQAAFKYYGTNLTWEINSGFIYGGLDYYLKNQPLGSTALVTNIESNSKSYSSISQFKARKTWETGFDFDFQLNAAIHKADYSDEKTLTGYSNNQKQYSVFTGLHKIFSNGIKLSGLLREELIDTKFIKPIPSLGVEYVLSQKSEWGFKANVSRNYHNPTLNQLYFQPGGNPDLRPEQGLTAETSLSNVWKSGNYELKNELTGFYSAIDDWILWQPSQFGYWEPNNIQTVHSRGLEYTGKISEEFWGIKISTMWKFAYTRTTNESTGLSEGNLAKGEQLIYIPEYSGGYTEMGVYKGFEFIWTSFYTGSRNTSTVSDPDNKPLPGYTISNLTLGKKINLNGNSLSIRFKVDNFFNKDYQSIQYRAMPGRNYFLMINFEY